ncbi:CLUMA_CG011134, isoform A [Clunio marinus]|uniref:CLUMA_CG011134, isoform A n=1 Tax=Clunio marinus TaxID=568069 RepID=A0A1J1IDC3_9DIPT|nr:CLUMA_CG011134, isoform A [Clunio marinus]
MSSQTNSLHPGAKNHINSWKSFSFKIEQIPIFVPDNDALLGDLMFYLQQKPTGKGKQEARREM